MSALNYSLLSKKELIAYYERGVDEIRAAVEGMNERALCTRTHPGKWSTHEVVCHVADFEVINAERLRRILAEFEPTLFNGEPDDFERALAYDSRNLEEELALIKIIRGQTGRILHSLPDEVWQRRGIHSTGGPLTFRRVVEFVTSHIPHHVAFIEQKRAVMRA